MAQNITLTAEELVRQSSMLRIVAVDPDETKIAGLRETFDAAGLYGERVSAHVGDPMTFGLPSYAGRVIVSEDLPEPEDATEGPRPKQFTLTRWIRDPDHQDTTSPGSEPLLTAPIGLGLGGGELP